MMLRWAWETRWCEILILSNGLENRYLGTLVWLMQLCIKHVKRFCFTNNANFNKYKIKSLESKRKTMEIMVFLETSLTTFSGNWSISLKDICLHPFRFKQLNNKKSRRAKSGPRRPNHFSPKHFPKNEGKFQDSIKKGTWLQ